MTEKMKSFRMGTASTTVVTLGPLVNADPGTSRGIGGRRGRKGRQGADRCKTPDGFGFFYPATVLTNVPDGPRSERGDRRRVHIVSGRAEVNSSARP